MTLSSAISIRGLFETHLTVSDLDRAIAFYRDVMGLTLAARFGDRDVAFFWVGAPRQAMLGLWQTGSGPQRMSLHTAFEISVQDVLGAVPKLRAAGLTPLDLASRPTDQPVVLAWMPAVAIYFHDPDGNLLEYIAMLPNEPQSGLGVITWSEWPHPLS